MSWPAAFALTLALEVPAYLAALSLVGSVAPVRALRLAVAVNAVSHPMLWFIVLPALQSALSNTGGVLVGEALVLVGESAALWWLLRRDPVVICAGAVVANGLSFLAGILLQS